MTAQFQRHDDGLVSLVDTSERAVSRMRGFFGMLHREFRYYRTIMDCTGISPEDSPVRTLGRFPSTTRDEYRDFLQPEALSRLSRSRFVCDYSSGSTGKCVLRLATPADELAEQAITEQVFHRAGMKRGDHFVCCDVGFPEIYDFYFRAARALGVRRTTYLHLNRDYERSLEPILRLAPDVLLTLPSLLARFWPHIRSLWPKGEAPIRSLIFMGEPMQPGFRQEVAETLGCGVFSFYGTTESGGLAGECVRGCGGHFDPSLVGVTIVEPQFVDEQTVQGELLLTSWHLRDNPVVKYRVGDIVRVTIRPCACGESTPRITLVERTHEGFVLAGLKLRYQTVLEALKRVTGELDLLTITLRDLPERDGHTLMQVGLPRRFESWQPQLLDALRFEIFELDDLYQFGLVRFELDFFDNDSLEMRKLRRVVDLRVLPGAALTDE